MTALQTPIPPRPSGQHTVLGLRTEAIELVRVGFVGLGSRGLEAIERWKHIPFARIGAFCDLSPAHLEAARQAAEDAGIVLYTDFNALCSAADLDLIYICTDWESHVPIALAAMEHGKHAAIEVPAATRLADLWALIDTAERTQRHCMMLENSVYDYFEMAVNNMVHQGLFGQVVHAEGGYLHPLGDKWTPWRIEFNARTRGDVYPTHGIGPACQVLDIHRHDLLHTLVSMDTAPFSGPALMRQHLGKEPEDYQNGDQTTTIIRTLRGKTILLQHDVVTPRPYDRRYQVVGTAGYAAKYPTETFFFKDPIDTTGLISRYEPDFVKPLKALGEATDHRGGMSFFMDYRLAEALHKGLPLDMDVYDLAEWCAIAELSERSIRHGGMPIRVPDFTRGAWQEEKKL